ncbi:MAG: pyridoxal-phosphate dependent enzyme [Thermomicrobiales bacterium]
MSWDTLFCPACEGSPEYPFTAWRCPSCLGPLSWHGPATFTRDQIDASSSFIWRYSATLPAIEPRIGYNERPTPMTSLSIGGARTLAKLETQHPTASFKDRGCALLVNAFAQERVERLVEDSSGNAASSLAGYAARAGIACTIFAPAGASPGKLIQAEAYGADVVRVEGSRADVAAAAEAQHDADRGVFYASHNWHPWFIAGVTTWALEIWEQRGFSAPTAIVAPVGSGSLILGAYAAFTMLRNGGEISQLPRLYAAQPAACAPVVTAVDSHQITTRRFAQQPTMAEGASIANPVRGSEVLTAIRATGGGAIAVSEVDIRAATIVSARQGLFIEPTSALAVAAAQQLIEAGTIPGTEETVVVLTGSGLKAQTKIADLLSSDDRNI